MPYFGPDWNFTSRSQSYENIVFQSKKQECLLLVRRYKKTIDIKTSNNKCCLHRYNTADVIICSYLVGNKIRSDSTFVSYCLFIYNFINRRRHKHTNKSLRAPFRCVSEITPLRNIDFT